MGLGGASMSIGGGGFSTNLSSRGIRSTVGIPGTGLAYSASSSSRSGRAPSRRQIEASNRRNAIAARRDAAVAEVEAAEADLDDLLNRWRDVPELPPSATYADATKPRPFTFPDPVPAPPDENLQLRLVHAEATASARTAHPFPATTVGIAAVVAAMAFVAGTVGAGVIDTGGFGAVVFAAVAVPGVALPIAVSIRKLANRSTALAREARRHVDEAWPGHWQEAQRQHLTRQHEWEARRDAAREVHEAADMERATWARRLVEGDLVAIEESVADSLSDVDVPFEALCRVAVPDATHAYVLLDLPEVDAVLPETRVKVLKSGEKREVKRPKIDRMTAYAELACGLAFLVARVALEAGPTLRTVTVAGYTQRQQKKSASIGDDFAYEVAITRDVSARLEHDDIDPVAECERLDARLKQTATGEFAKIPAPKWAGV